MFVIFGGSFDPVHIGHILIARDVKERLKAKKIIFIPAYHAPLKEGHRASPEDRLNMLKIALEKEEDFVIEDYEIRRKGVSYTVDTLEYLTPKLGEKPYLLLGADSVLKFHLWKKPKRILDLANIIVIDRGGKIEIVKDYLKNHFPDLKEGENLILLSIRRIDLSATEIRNRLREGKSVYCMVPDKVREYIEQRGLYR